MPGTARQVCYQQQGMSKEEPGGAAGQPGQATPPAGRPPVRDLPPGLRAQLSGPSYAGPATFAQC